MGSDVEAYEQFRARGLTPFRIVFSEIGGFRDKYTVTVYLSDELVDTSDEFPLIKDTADKEVRRVLAKEGRQIAPYGVAKCTGTDGEQMIWESKRYPILTPSKVSPTGRVPQAIFWPE